MSVYLTNNLSQKQMVLLHLKEFGKITTFEAFSEYGITRLSQYIYLLRKDGYDLASVPKHKTNRYGKEVWFNEYQLRDN